MSAAASARPGHRGYRLTGPEHELAAKRGPASGDWYQSPVPRSRMTDLVARSNRRAAIATAVWLTLLAVTGVVAHLSWGTWWALPAFAAYGTMYGSVCDARWHECGHGTAFKAQWANTVIYDLASFMAFREPVSWRWSHARHHDDTIIVGRDPEIAVPRPTSLLSLASELLPTLRRQAKDPTYFVHRALPGEIGTAALSRPSTRRSPSGAGARRPDVSARRAECGQHVAWPRVQLISTACVPGHSTCSSSAGASTAR